MSVSCRAWAYFESCEARGLVDLDELLEGSHFRREDFAVRTQRVPWDDWARLCDRFAELLGSDEAVEASTEVLHQSDIAGSLLGLAGMIADPADAYRIAFRYLAPTLYQAPDFHIEALPDRRLRFTVEIPPPHRPSRAWMVMIRAAIVQVPRFVGLPDAIALSREMTARRVEVLLALPPSRTLWRRATGLISAALSTHPMVEEFEYQQQQITWTLERLRDNERGYEQTLEMLPSGVALHRHGELLYANQPLRRWLGLPERPTLAQLREAVSEGEPLDEVLDVGEGRVGPVAFRTADGAHHLEVTGMPGPSFAGAPANLLFVRDVTAQRRAEEAAARGERTRWMLTKALPDLVLRTTAEGELLDYLGGSEPIGALFGELVGQNLFTETLADRTRTAVDVRREALAAIDRARTTGAVQTIEVRTMALDREQILEVRISPAEDELLFFVRDVTERRALESQLAISERMASVGTLAAGAAHEINNPLTYVLANLRFALEELDDGTEALRDVRESLGDALDGAERIAGIVGDLKSYSRVSEETVDGRVDLAAVVEHAKRLSQSQVRHRGARLSLRLGSAPPVRGDENRLVQVLVNLILNALHALEDGGPREVEIRLGREPGWALLEIADSGRGMTTEVQKRIFDPFFTTKGLGGTGLGLSIVHNIVSEHGGAIAVRSREGEGTTFTVRLPSMLAEDAAPHRAASEHPAAKAKRALRVLVIDDDAPVRQAVARMLIAHEVRMASAGAEGLEVVEGFDPEVILCDLMMPGMDGLEVYRRLDARGLGPRVVFMTGGLLEDEDREHVDAWGVPVLRKPFSPKELEARLAERLEAPSRCVPLAV